MLRRLIYALLLAGIAGGFIYTLFFLREKSQAKPKIFETESPFYTDIRIQSIANGTINPRKIIAIKPQVSGIVEKLYVKEGQFVNIGQLLAFIKIIPNPLQVANAENDLKLVKLSFENTEREYLRQEDLLKQQVISDFEFQRYLREYQTRKQEVQNAEERLQLLLKGANRPGQASNQIFATVSGTILDIPVEEGGFVIESNTFNEGTTIATVANLGDMIFEGTLVESDVGKLKPDMDIFVSVGAFDESKYKAKLEFVAPQGKEVNGNIEFELKASMQLNDSLFLRAGYSATAHIIIDDRKNVLAIRERNLRFDENKKPFVEIEIKPQVFEKKYVQIGLSDGMNCQIISGIAIKDRLKVITDLNEDNSGMLKR